MKQVLLLMIMAVTMFTVQAQRVSHKQQAKKVRVKFVNKKFHEAPVLDYGTLDIPISTGKLGLGAIKLDTVISSSGEKYLKFWNAGTDDLVYHDTRVPNYPSSEGIICTGWNDNIQLGGSLKLDTVTTYSWTDTLVVDPKMYNYIQIGKHIYKLEQDVYLKQIN